MAYRRKRYYRRKSKKLSNYNIATKTSAKSQAQQIYALKRKINYYIKQTKPSTFVQQRVSQLTNVANPGFMRWYKSASALVDFIFPELGTPQSSTSSSNVSNAQRTNFARSYDLHLYGQLSFQPDKLTATTLPVSLRLVVVQYPKTRASNLLHSDIFTSGVNSLGQDAVQPYSSVFGPLQNGVSRNCRVLFDRVYTISFQRPQQRIFIYLKRLFNFYQDNNSSQGGNVESEAIPKGAISVYYSAFSIGGIDTVVNQFSLISKLTYTVS